MGIDQFGTRTAITTEVFETKKAAWNSIEEGNYNWPADYEIIEVLRLEEVETPAAA